MASRFWKLINGLNLVPKNVSTATEQGDLEVVNGRLQYLDTDNGAPSPVITQDSTDDLTNKTLTDPDITVQTNPIKFQDPTGTKKISVTAPAGLVPDDYTLTLPPDVGTMDYLLRTDGAGGTSWTPATSGFIPTGIVLPFAGPEASVPAGWLILGGQAVSRATYVSLFTLFGTTYGPGDGMNTFNLPDMRGRTAVGKDDMGGSPANRVTNAASGITGTTLGASGGTQTHTLVTGEMPSHTHTQDAHSHGVGTYANGTSAVSGTITASPSAVSGTVGGSDGTHTHTFTTGTQSSNHRHSHPASASGGGDGGTGTSNDPYGNVTGTGQAYVLNSNGDNGAPGYVGSSVESADHTHSGTTNTTGSGHSHAHSLTAAAQSIIHSLTAAAQTITGTSASTIATNQNTGGGGAHQNMQPTLILNYIIKT